MTLTALIIIHDSRVHTSLMQAIMSVYLWCNVYIIDNGATEQRTKMTGFNAAVLSVSSLFPYLCYC